MTVLKLDLHYLTLNTSLTGICLNILKDDCFCEYSYGYFSRLFIEIAFLLIMNVLSAPCPLP